ncbi:hypothetical protein HOD29_05860 [archaeon]|jgi:hypothetical protein|nr:hypothetical protein [archaeon]
MEKDIGKLQKNDTTDIILRVDDFGGRRGFTIREFVTSDRYTGFTKSGVRILATDFPKFKEMVNSVSEEEMAEVVPAEQTTLDETPKEAPVEEKPVEEKPTEAPKEELPDY